MENKLNFYEKQDLIVKIIEKAPDESLPTILDILTFAVIENKQKQNESNFLEYDYRIDYNNPFTFPWS